MSDFLPGRQINRKRFSLLFAALALIGLPPLVNGHGYQVGGIRIVHPWALSTTPSIIGEANGMGFLVLRNSGHKPDKLLAAFVEIARKVELYAHGKGGDTSTMHPVEAIEIPAGGEVRLEPNGPHLMLIGLKPATDSAPAGAPVRCRLSRRSAARKPSAAPTQKVGDDCTITQVIFYIHIVIMADCE